MAGHAGGFARPRRVGGASRGQPPSTSPGVRSPLKRGRIYRRGVRLHDVPVFERRNRGRYAEFGAGRRGRSGTWLGRVRVLSVDSGIAVGKVAAPELARSQAAGSVIQGVGYAIYESSRGRFRQRLLVLSAGLEDYRIPGIADTPLLDLYFDEGGFDHVPGGSVGIGEVATVPTSPAIANAICNVPGQGRRDSALTRPSPHRAQAEGLRHDRQRRRAGNGPEFRAAGTDLSERRRSGVSEGRSSISCPPRTRYGDLLECRQRGPHRRAAPTIGAIAADARSRTPIRAWCGRRGSPPRRSVTLQRSAATSPSVRAAGTIAIPFRLPEEGRRLGAPGANR